MTGERIVVIGGSWGALRAMQVILAGLPAGLDATVAVALHRGADAGPGLLASILAGYGPLPVQEVDDKDPLVPGRVFLAPPDYHLLVDGQSFALSVDERVHHSRPSIDVLFESAADALGERVVAVLLTGSNADGAAGLAHVRRRDGIALVQDPAGAERREMPEAAILAGAFDRILPLEEIAPALAAECGAGRAGEPA
jgi:two-component system, chemotaxis family, protein-glutamate methylesterase/glutaminase